MKIEIINQIKNPFMEREEYTLKVSNKVTPSLEDVKVELRKDISLTVIKKINTNFGVQTFLVEAVVYDNKEAMKKIETIPKKVRKKIEAEEKATIEAARKTGAEAKISDTTPPKEKTEDTNLKEEVKDEVGN